MVSRALALSGAGVSLSLDPPVATWLGIKHASGPSPQDLLWAAVFVDQGLGLWRPSQAAGTGFQIGSYQMDTVEGAFPGRCPPLQRQSSDLLHARRETFSSQDPFWTLCLWPCLESKKIVSTSTSGHGQKPSVIKVRPVALFLMTEQDSVAVWAVGSPLGCGSSVCVQRPGSWWMRSQSAKRLGFSNGYCVAVGRFPQLREVFSTWEGRIALLLILWL